MLVPAQAGLKPDNVGMWGLTGLLFQTNLYSLTFTSITTVAGANSAVSAAQLMASLINLDAGANGGFQLNLPATSVIIDAIGPSAVNDGTWAIPVMVKNNNVGQTATITAGDGSTTLTGTMTVATNTTRTLLLRKTSATTMELVNLGTMGL